jgi:hypothetical protein
MIGDSESDRLMDLFRTWLFRARVAALTALVLIVVVGVALGAPAHPLPLPVIGILVGFFLLAFSVPAGISARYLFIASRVRARVNAETPGLSGFVARHGVAIGLAVLLVVGVIVIALRHH